LFTTLVPSKFMIQLKSIRFNILKFSLTSAIIVRIQVQPVGFVESGFFYNTNLSKTLIFMILSSHHMRWYLMLIITDLESVSQQSRLSLFFRKQSRLCLFDSATTNEVYNFVVSEKKKSWSQIIWDSDTMRWTFQWR
jgi:hypothetical protein